MKKQVLQLIGSFHQGGSERQAIALTRLLNNDGSFEIFVATLNNDGVLRHEIDAIGLSEIPEFPLTSFYNANFVRQVRRCANYLRDNKIDLIQTHDFYTNVFGMVAATLAGVPALVASKRETSGVRSASQEFVEKLAFGRAHAIVVNSKSVKKYLTDLGINTDKIKVIYNSLDLKRFAKIDQCNSNDLIKLGLPTADDIQFITIVANLRHNVKNLPMLLRASKRVIGERSLAHFVIAGEGELEGELNNLAKQLGVAQNIHFIGRSTDIPALLGVSDICVLTSTAEGFANSILEYMAAGKPVVATNVGGASEVIADGVSGYLIDSDDYETMAARLIELLDDKQKAARYGAAGRRIVTGLFSESIQLRDTIGLYNSLLK